ncbi:MAG TPA: hypothetical protein VHG91_13810 [Longimicrobium sp.]|nr:hypothetical protein [Longimicrobium sp.]
MISTRFRFVLPLAALALAAPAAAQSPASALPDTAAEVRPAGIVEREVTVGSGEWALPGVLTLPAGRGPFPALALMHGSGPGTRDGDVGPNKVAREWAWGLAARGVATLRYDKRITAHEARFRALGRSATVAEEHTDDGLAAVRLLQTLPEVDRRRVYVHGGSQSTLVAPGIANATGAAGVLLVAAAARSPADMVREQVTYAASLHRDSGDTAKLRQTERLLARVDLLERPESPDTLTLLGLPFAYWRSLRASQMRADLDALLARGGRALVVHGGRDFLVTDEDFATLQRWFAGRRSIGFRRYAGLNHLMQPGVGRMRPEEYGERGRVSAELIGDVADWILRG